MSMLVLTIHQLYTNALITGVDNPARHETELLSFFWPFAKPWDWLVVADRRFLLYQVSARTAMSGRAWSRVVQRPVAQVRPARSHQDMGG